MRREPAHDRHWTRRPCTGGDDDLRLRTVSSSNGWPDQDTPADGEPPIPALLAAIDGLVRDAHLRERFGDLGPALSLALGSWMEPFGAAMRGLEPTPHSQAAARAIADVARLAGAFARDAAYRSAAPSSPIQPADGAFARDAASPSAGVRAAPESAGDAGGFRHYAELAARVDDAFREFSSGPEFDEARRRAIAAVLDWLEHDRAAASSIARALASTPTRAMRTRDAPTPPDSGPDVADGRADPAHVSTPARATRPRGDSAPPDPATGTGDGGTGLIPFPGTGEPRASVLVVPGFTTGPSLFDLEPQRSFVRTLAAHGAAVWLLDWSQPGQTGERRTVTDLLARIDRAIDAVRAASFGRRPALAGHFHGGLLALLYGIRYPGKAGALITLSTPVEFGLRHDVFAGWLRACDGDRLADVFGDIPGPLTAALAAAASPTHWCGGGLLALLGGLDPVVGAARIARFEQARRFPPDFPGETFRALHRAFYRDDSFAVNGAAVLDGHRYDLGDLVTPLLNVFAHNDRVVPPDASLPLERWAARAPGSSREHQGGHFDLMAGHGAHEALLPGIAAWVIEAIR